MSERFDLEKWRAELDRAIGNYCGHEDKPENRLPDGDCAKCNEIVDEVLPVVSEAVTGAENHQRELMGCGHPRACGHFHIDLRGFPSDRVCHCDMPEAQRKICTVCAELSRVRQQARAEATEQCAIEAGERSPEGVSSHTMLGDMWDERIRNCRALIPAEVHGAPSDDSITGRELGAMERAELHHVEDARQAGCPCALHVEIRRDIESRASERTKRLREALATLKKALGRELEYAITHWQNCEPTYPACSCGASQVRAHAITVLAVARRALESE